MNTMTRTLNAQDVEILHDAFLLHYETCRECGPKGYCHHGINLYFSYREAAHELTGEKL